MKPVDIVRMRLRESSDLKAKMIPDAQLVAKVAVIIAKAFRTRHQVLLFGNGGSAADAQHIAAELTGRFAKDRDPLPAIALTTNTSSLTAIANDYDFDEVFARMVRAHARRGDIVIGISTSGSSENVIRGVKAGKAARAFTIALCGQGGRLKDVADLTLSVPSKETPRIQEAHITLGHIICELVEADLFGGR
jgi:D-sedoheptulose 7-phosphate isomerase